METPIRNIADLTLDTWTQGSLYGGSDTSFGALLRLKGLGISYNEVQPGKSGCPFHNHHVEDEMFIVLEGTGTYRFGADSHPIKAGDVLGAPAGGTETAHQLINTGATVLRYYGISTKAATEVCEYPDSGKVLTASRPGGLEAGKVRHMHRAGAESIDYWDGEPGA
ncbi:MAG: hypothetical protein JWR75_274 [Devosia sp.]|nr:hypothetical protein [Devosia sp.]